MTNKNISVQFDSIVLNTNANSMKQLFQIIADHVSQLIGCSKKTLYSKFLENEKDESSVIGNGVAIPHMRLSRLTKSIVMFYTLQNSIINENNDAVDMICVVLSPDYEGTRHLQRLAKVSRFFSNNNNVQEIQSCENSQQIKNTMEQLQNERMAA